ncbi:MAG: MBL fold metallo-hydrolase [Nitrososphaerales archaeon]
MGNEIVVRVNGALPAFSELGKDNPRILEVESNPAMNVNTSCSLLIITDGRPLKHIVIDTGNGVVNSIKQECDGGLLAGRCSIDAVLLTHSHADRIDDLPSMVKEFRTFHVHSTGQCWDAFCKKFPDLKSIQHTSIEAGKMFEIVGIKITPIAVQHANDALGSVTYVAEFEDKKIVFAWDVLSFVDTNDPVLKGADLLIIDTFTYNPHQETEHLSVLEAYDLVKRWNPKEAYLINYSGYQDFKNQENPYARVPKRPMTSDELASQVMSDVTAWGIGWTERIKVARRGMIWRSGKQLEVMSPQFAEDMVKIFTEQNYVFSIKEGKKGLEVTAETDIVNLNYELIKFNVESEGRRLTGSTKGGLLAKPVRLLLEISDSSEPAIVEIRIGGGSNIKMIDQDTSYQKDIKLKKIDADRLRDFLARLMH